MSSDNTDALVAEISPKKKIATIIFYIGILCELIVSFSGYMIGGYHEPVIIVAGMGCFALKILLDFDYKNPRAYALAGVMAAYGLICYFSQHSALVLRVALFILAAQDQKPNDIIRVFFCGTLLGMVINGILAAAGIHGALTVTDTFRHVPETRWTFGFIHPNGFAMFTFKLMVMGVYLYADKMKKWMMLLYFAIFGAVLILADSKMSLLAYGWVVLLTIVFVWLGKYSEKLLKAAGYLILSIIAIFLIYSRVGGYFTGSPFGAKLWLYVQFACSGRNMWSFNLMDSVNPTLLGVGKALETTEVGYVNTMYQEGIIFLLIFAVVAVWLVRYYSKRQDFLAIILITGMLAYMVAEAFLPYLNKNIVWIMLAGIPFYAPGSAKAEKMRNKA